MTEQMPVLVSVGLAIWIGRATFNGAIPRWVVAWCMGISVFFQAFQILSSLVELVK